MLLFTLKLSSFLVYLLSRLLLSIRNSNRFKLFLADEIAEWSDIFFNISNRNVTLLSAITKFQFFQEPQSAFVAVYFFLCLRYFV